MKTIEQIEAIQTAKPDTELRVCRRAEMGTVLHQGDVYLHRVADDWPRGKELGTRQVAVGSTVGARHIVEGDVVVLEGTTLPPGMDPVPELLGPVVVVGGDSAVLTHPEHAHHQFPCGVWQVTYQLDLVTRQRVAD